MSKSRVEVLQTAESRQKRHVSWRSLVLEEIAAFIQLSANNHIDYLVIRKQYFKGLYSIITIYYMGVYIHVYKYVTNVFKSHFRKL